MPQTKSAIVYVRLTQQQRTWLDEIVTQSGGIGTMSDHIRKALDDYIKAHLNHNHQDTAAD